MKAFGSYGMASLLPGGQNTFVVGDIVLKPVPNIDEANPPRSGPRERHWTAEVFVGPRGDGFRIPYPIRTLEGSWVCDGWAAWTRVDGDRGRTRRNVSALSYR